MVHLVGYITNHRVQLMLCGRALALDVLDVRQSREYRVSPMKIKQ